MLNLAPWSRHPSKSIPFSPSSRRVHASCSWGVSRPSRTAGACRSITPTGSTTSGASWASSTSATRTTSAWLGKSALMRVRYGLFVRAKAWRSMIPPAKLGGFETTLPTPFSRSSPPLTSPPCWPASRNVTPSSPPVKKPAASSPRPSAALYRPLEALWTSVLTASGACPPLPAPIPCRWKRRLTPIGNYSDYSSKPAFLSKLISLSLPQTSSAPPA